MRGGVPNTMELFFFWADSHVIPLTPMTRLNPLVPKFQDWLWDMGLEYLYKDSPFHCFCTPQSYLDYKAKRDKIQNTRDLYVISEDGHFYMRKIPFQDIFNFVRSRVRIIFKEAWDFYIEHNTVLYGEKFTLNFSNRSFFNKREIEYRNSYLGWERAFEEIFTREDLIRWFLSYYLSFVRYHE